MDDLQPTQQTQSTQEEGADDVLGSMPAAGTYYWAILKPLFPQHLSSIVLYNLNQAYHVGRNPASSIVLPGPKISNKHCIINKESQDAEATIRDLSTNGTFVNGRRVGKGNSCLLKDGNEVAFGSLTPAENSAENYRFMYSEYQLNPTGIHLEYDVGNVLGHGTFATVCRAVHRKSGVVYAVKRIHNLRGLPSAASVSSLGSSVTPAESVRREVTILQNLKHENICRLHEIFLDEMRRDSGISLVLEYVDGGDLLTYICDQEGLDEGQAQDIALQICSALAYCHERDVAHRDLKPENVLLTRDRPPIVKVADFGLAKATDSMTMLKTMCGTPNYLAPEVVSEDVDSVGYDHLVDSWSIGIITFSMLTNTVAFADDDIADIKLKVRSRQVQWEYLDGCRISENCFDFIRQLLITDPKERLSMAESLVHPWFLSHVPFYRFDQTTWQWRSNRQEIDEPKSFRAASNLLDAHQIAQPEPAAAPVPASNIPMSSQDSIFPTPPKNPLQTPAQSHIGRTPEIPGAPQKQGGKLRRRRDILEELEEKHLDGITPDAQMLVKWERAVDGDAAAAGPSVEPKGPNKRVHEEEDVEMQGSSSPDGNGVDEDMLMSPKKKGRTGPASKKKASPPPPTRKSNRIARR